MSDGLHRVGSTERHGRTASEFSRVDRPHEYLVSLVDKDAGCRNLLPPKETRTTKLRQNNLELNRLRAKLAVVESGGIEAARKDLFSQSGMRATKRSIRAPDLPTSTASVSPTWTDISLETSPCGHEGPRDLLDIASKAYWSNLAHPSASKSTHLQENLESSMVLLSDYSSASRTTNHTTHNQQGKQLLNGKLKNAIPFLGDEQMQIPATSKDILVDENSTQDSGQLSQHIYVALVIGDWSEALKHISDLSKLDSEQIELHLQFKDPEGNTLMHLAVMDPEAAINLESSQAKLTHLTTQKRTKFADTVDQEVREKILERLFMLDNLLLVQVNNGGHTPLECCVCPTIKEFARMLVRQKHLRKKRSFGFNVGIAFATNRARGKFKALMSVKPDLTGILADDHGESDHQDGSDEEDSLQNVGKVRKFAKTPGGLKSMLDRCSTSMGCASASSNSRDAQTSATGQILVSCVLNGRTSSFSRLSENGNDDNGHADRTSTPIPFKFVSSSGSPLSCDSGL